MVSFVIIPPHKPLKSITQTLAGSILQQLNPQKTFPRTQLTRDRCFSYLVLPDSLYFFVLKGISFWIITYLKNDEENHPFMYIYYGNLKKQKQLIQSGILYYRTCIINYLNPAMTYFTMCLVFWGVKHWLFQFLTIKLHLTWYEPEIVGSKASIWYFVTSN